MSHEIVLRFRENDVRLRPTLEEMLDDHPVHCTDRRGCGFTQATRFLSSYINAPAQSVATDDLGIFAQWPRQETAAAAEALVEAGWPHGWRRLHEAPAERVVAASERAPIPPALVGLGARIRTAAAGLVRTESLLFARFVEQLLARDHEGSVVVPPMPEKPEIGSCSQAEEFFLELAHGRIRRGGSVNILVDGAGDPVMIEKMNLGESHSAVVLKSISINGVGIPPGSLCALAHLQGVSGRLTAHGECLPIIAVAQARFLRLTTLAVSPDECARAFGPQLDAQLRTRMISPATTTLDELRSFARSELRSRR